MYPSPRVIVCKKVDNSHFMVPDKNRIGRNMIESSQIRKYKGSIP